MVLPLLLSMGLPALAGTGALGATMAGLSVPMLSGLGAGLGGFMQTGDIGKGIQTGLMAGIGGKVLGGLTNSAAPAALTPGAAAVPQPGFVESLVAPAPSAASVVSTTPPSALSTKFLGAAGAAAPAPFVNQAIAPGATKGGALTAAQQSFIPGMMAQTMTDAQVMQQEEAKRAAEKAAGDTTVPMPNAMRRTYNPTPYYNGGGEGSFFQYQRPTRADGSEVKAPYTYAEGGYVNTNGPIDRSQLTGKGAGRTATQNPNETYINMLAVPKDNPLHEGQDYYEEMIGLDRGRDTSYPSAMPMQGQGQPLQQYGQYLDNTYDNFDQKRNMFLSNVREQEQQTFGQRQGQQNPFMGNGFQDQPNPFLGQLGGFGGIMAFKEGGEVEADQMMAQNGMNEKDVIVSAIEAIKGMSEQPEIVLAMFVQKYGEDALSDLVGRVQSGELDDTVQRFEEGDKGMVRGPGDGSGVDDMVPATLEGEQDVLLSDGEFVLREKTTDALEKAYGGGFLDMVNRAEEEAPKKLQQMVG